MATKIVRMYLTTFVDAELEENDFTNEEEMKEYARLNASDYITPQDVYDNICYDPTDIDIYNENDL